jgi:hypothetical protein
MQKIVLTLAALVLLASPAIAEDGYSFHIAVTDGRTGLEANPRFADLKMSEQQLESASHDRVLVLDHTEDAHWNWLMLSWPEGKSNVEHGINSRGTASVEKDADVGLTPGEKGSVIARCIREFCRIHATSPNPKETIAELTKGTSVAIPFDSDVEIAFTR